jgi:hypothetical protein
VSKQWTVPVFRQPNISTKISRRMKYQMEVYHIIYFNL